MSMDKNAQLLILGTVLTLGAAGLMWMVSTLVSVDKRTEVINVKMDHLVETIDGLAEKQASIDKSWTDTLSSLSASRKSD